MKDTSSVSTSVAAAGPVPSERETTRAEDTAPAKLIQQLRQERQRRERLAVELEDVRKRYAQLEEKFRLLSRAKDASERRLAKRPASTGRESEGLDPADAPIAKLLRRADDLEAALYELHALYAASQTTGPEASHRLGNLQVLSRIRTVVRDTVPRDATVIVVSKGDPELLKLHGREAGHFPQTMDGVYAGAYPKTSTAAIAHLETLRAKGASYLVIPAPSLWWLDHYGGFRDHLTRRYRLVADSLDTCRIFALREPAIVEGAATREAFQGLVAEFQQRYNRRPSILDWNSGLGLAGSFPEHTIFSPPARKAVLPYLDKSVDIAVLPSGAPALLAEARRVAQGATVRVASDGRATAGSPLVVEWSRNGAAPTLATTSIIVPCHNNSRDTKVCLRSLLETLPPTFAGEIIVVDDASTDETPQLLKRVAAADQRVRIVRNAKNSGFILSCNRGAKAATGDVLLFLNNDTILLPDWLPPILRVFRDDRKTGVVGGKLLFPDGRLQEAGGLVFRDGSAAHFGRGDYDTDGFLYQFLREVDYCSGAFLATPRALFDQLGGFDRRYLPAYYEDVDYCFKTRKKGYRVYYQPESTIVHMEGASGGADPSQGMKRYFTVNQKKFAERWKPVLAKHPVRPRHEDAPAWQVLAVTKREGK